MLDACWRHGSGEGRIRKEYRSFLILMCIPEIPILSLSDKFPAFISYCSLNEVSVQCRHIAFQFTSDVQKAVIVKLFMCLIN
jgi:hypothetical protein